MAMSDDEEGEIIPYYITNYSFVDGQKAAVSFSVLPVLWDWEDELRENSELEVYIQGAYDDGLQNVFKRAVAWKFELSVEDPVMYVLSKERNWMILQKPRKSYLPVISSILVTVHWLHFKKRNAGDNTGSGWNHFLQSWSFLEIEPAKKHLQLHSELVKEARSKDEDLAKSSFPLTIKIPPQTSIPVNKEVQPSRILDVQRVSEEKEDMEEEEEEEAEEEEEEDEDDGYFDTVCSICDDGGQLLCCNGMCLRSFHATLEDGERSGCTSLGFSRKEEVDAIQNFMCKNCLYTMHQCFACGKLGSSAKSPCQEVYQCASASCGHFYHAECVSRLLYPRDKVKAADLPWRIGSGESFICPAHKCHNCKKVEDINIDKLKFATCRRCPKSYHKICLPSGIKFDSDDYNTQRAWEGLLKYRRVLIYCLDHEIDEELGTPTRNHLVFPDHVQQKRAKQLLEHRLKAPHLALPPNRDDRTSVLKEAHSDPPTKVIIDQVQQAHKKVIDRVQQAHPDPHTKMIIDRVQQAHPDRHTKVIIDRVQQAHTKVMDRFQQAHTDPPTKVIDRVQQAQRLVQKLNRDRPIVKSAPHFDSTKGIRKRYLDQHEQKLVSVNKLFRTEAGKMPAKEIHVPLVHKKPPFATSSSATKPTPSMFQPKPRIQEKQAVPSLTSSALKNLTDLPYFPQAILEQRMKKLMEDSASEFEIEKTRILENARKAGHFYGCNSGFAKSLTFGLIENYVQAVHTAKQKLHNGSIDDALAVCPRQTLTTLSKWEAKLNSYLTPFFHGMRYTSYGRHFTKPDKLKEIVNRLHPYVRPGDMIVDFCCGSNDFSLMMKEKLDRIGKPCFYRNYDLIQTKNDFCFQRKNWMHVKPGELPDGSRLIMGLNPPFGKRAALANAFIKQALKFRPKLLILIVPKETKRHSIYLDRLT
ncbi:Protein ENHANCED DOWNY MILDEW 2 [Linum perenne]